MENIKTDQRIFITGGASGLGRAIALKFARCGWRVCIGDINTELAEKTRSEIEAEYVKAKPDSATDSCALYYPCDVRNQQQIDDVRERILERWGGLDVVVNNAGVAGTNAFAEEISQDDWDWVLEINLLGPVRIYRSFSSVFKRQRSGHFVNIASAAGIVNAPSMANYNVSKAGLISFSESTRFELAKFGVNVSVVCPSFFVTNLAATIRGPDGHPDEGFRRKIEKMMQRSDISAEDVADDIFAAVKRKGFWVLPHKYMRRLWLFKRLMPELFFKRLVNRYQN